LRTGVLEKCHGAVLKKRKGLREEITAIDAKVSIPKAKLEDINIDAMKEEVEEFEELRQEKISVHKAQAKKQKVEAKKIIDQVGGMSFENPGKELGEVEDEISELEKIKSGLSKAEEEHEKAREKADLSTSLRASAKLCLVEVSADVKTNAGQLSKLKGGICPTCTADLKKGDSTKYVKKLKAERKKLIAEKSELKKELATFESKEEEAHDQINEAFSKVAECRDAQLEIDKLLVKVGELKESKTKYSFEKMKLKASAKACVDLARAELYRIKEIKEEENPYSQSLKKARKKAAGFRKQIKQFESDKRSVQGSLSYVEFWERGFSNQGLPSYILDSVMPFVEKRANVYLRVLADGDIKLGFSTQRELKSRDEKKDEIEITWEIEGKKNYPPSGGQQKKIEIATDLALMDLVATKEGEHVDLLALDEVLDGLDSEGCRRVLNLLRKLRKHRGSIFVVSHSSDVVEVFEKSIAVVKSGGVSIMEAI